MKQKWKKIYSSNDKIVWLNYITNEIKTCYLTYKDGTLLPKGWKRWFSDTYQLFYYTYNDNNGHKQIKWERPNKSNQYDYSPKIEPSTVISLNLNEKDDLKKIYDILGTDRFCEMDLILIWNGITIPCFVEKVEDIYYIQIKGKRPGLECLNFIILKNDKKVSISMLYVFDNNCPGPEKGQGWFFLALVDEICRQLEIKTLTLSDGSYITSKDGLEVSLEFQSLMKYGFSWYERQGFFYESKTKKDIVNKIRNTPISKIKDSLVDFAKDKSNKLPSKIYNTLRIIEEYQKDEKNTDSLSGFITYVWNKNDSNNFPEYIEILSVLYPDEGKRYIDESILPDFPRETSMIKVFSV